MQRFIRIVKGAVIWIVAFFAFNIANAMIFPQEFSIIVVPLSFFASTIVSSKLSPVHDLFGQGCRTFLTIVRYISDFVWVFCAMMGIFDTLRFDVISIPVCVFCVFISLLIPYFVNRTKIKAAYKHLNNIAPPKGRKQQPTITMQAPSLHSTQSTAQASKPMRRSTTLARIDKMDGHEFEVFTAQLLRQLGYERVQVTPISGDQGVDVIAVKDGVKYAIQCKRYASKLGNTPIQEVFAGKTIYGCQVAVVLTNNYFTDGAKEAARATGVELWDRDKLKRMIIYAEHMAERSAQ